MKTTQELIKEIYELVGENFPIRFRTEFFKVVEITYEKDWRVGGTTTATREDGTTYFKEDYVEKKLSSKQIDIIDNWITEVVNK